MTEEVLRSLAAWIKPAVLQLTQEDLETYRQAVLSLAARDVGAEIVAAAHGHISTAAREQVEGAVIQIDPTFVGGDQDELVAHLAAAAVMVVLADSAKMAVRPALLVQSARFAGLEPKITDLLSRADQIADAESRRARERMPFKKQSSSIKVLPASATIEEMIPVLNASVKHLEGALAAAYIRIRQNDEEVDTLWWARSANSGTAGKPWADLPDLERVLTACVELRGLLSFFPPTLGEIALLGEVGGQPGGTVKLTQVGSALASTEIAEYSEHGPLFPLTTAAALSAEYGEKPKVVAPLLEKAGCDPKMTIPLNNLAVQLLREISLAELS